MPLKLFAALMIGLLGSAVADAQSTEEFAAIHAWSESLPQPLSEEPPLTQAGESYASFRAWCKRVTGVFRKRPDAHVCEFPTLTVTYKRRKKYDEMVQVWKGFPGSGESMNDFCRAAAEEYAAQYRELAETFPNVRVNINHRKTEWGAFKGTGTLKKGGRIIGRYEVARTSSSSATATSTLYTKAKP